jgi:hypothetical protein
MEATVITVRPTQFQKELEMNGESFVREGTRFTVELNPKVKMAIRMMKERYGQLTILFREHE